MVNGNEPGHPGRSYIVAVDGGKPEPVTPEGVYATLPSPDGKYVVGANADNQLSLFPLDGGPARPIPNVDPAYLLAQWSADSKALFVFRQGEVPLKIERLDVATGKAKLVRQLFPMDLGCVVSIGPLIMHVTASEFAYSYYQTLSVLYVISGLK